MALLIFLYMGILSQQFHRLFDYNIMINPISYELFLIFLAK